VAEAELLPVVEDIAQNGVIRGTKEYNNDEFIGGAKAATTCRVFPAWNEGGRVFYKVREHALDPRNFKDSGDSGTLAVRYVVQAQGEKNTVLRIDALFVEEFRRTVHPSNGSVESSEYKDIQEHLAALDVMKKENIEAGEQRQQQLNRKLNPGMLSDVPGSQSSSSKPPSRTAENAAVPMPQAGGVAGAGETADQSASVQVPAGTSLAESSPTPSSLSGTSLEEHVKDLRRQVERLVKAPGAALKSAPFHTASTLQSLPKGTEILIVISTPYWYGVETHDGQRGWIVRDQLDLP
jgi:polyhydroxyalkanoate synthesis regulator phasin